MQLLLIDEPRAGLFFLSSKMPRSEAGALVAQTRVSRFLGSSYNPAEQGNALLCILDP